MTYDQWKTDSGYREPNEAQAPIAAPEPKLVECPNCHDANKYGDYQGPTCEVCGGVGSVAILPPAAQRWEIGKNGWDASDEATREDI